MTKIIRQHFSMTGFNNTKKGVNSKCFYQFLFYFRFQNEDQVIQMTECLLGFFLSFYILNYFSRLIILVSFFFEFRLLLCKCWYYRKKYTRFNVTDVLQILNISIWNEYLKCQLNKDISEWNENLLWNPLSFLWTSTNATPFNFMSYIFFDFKKTDLKI